MSAANGIYVGHFSDGEYRVIHAQAIDNLDWQVPLGCDYNPEQVVNYFDHSPHVGMDKTAAFKYAVEKEKEYDYLEYGICSITFAHPFGWYREQADLLLQRDNSAG